MSDGEAEPAAAQTEANDSVARILKQLQNTGALIKKPKEEHRCVTCDESFRSWEELENHLIQHVSLPSIILERLPSDDEDVPSGDDWSDEDEAPATAPPAAKTPQKLDISQIAKLGIQIKKPGDAAAVSSSGNALNKLSGLGFTIKKGNTPIKEEKTDEKNSPNKDLMQKLGSLGGIKLKLKSDGSNTNSFSVINGLRNFKTSDDEDEGSGNEAPPSDEDKSPAPDSDDEQNGGKSDDSGGKTPLANVAQSKTETPKVVSKPAALAATQNRRPAVKQTPKRGANLPIGTQVKPQTQPQAKQITATQPAPAVANDTMENVVVKKEMETDTAPQNAPLFSGQIKTERTSPPPGEVPASIPLISNVKSETDTGQPPLPSTTEAPSLLLNALGTPLPPVTKTENEGVTIVEINGDSDDDDCCVVSATPAPDVKPVVPKTENTMAYTTPYQSTPTAAYSTTSNAQMPPPAYGAQEKQHSFNWNAPDSKPAIDMLEKSADDIFQSLLSSTKKEGLSTMGDTSEYISLDRLGSQHTCDVCNTRFTDVSLLDDHIRQTGHSKSIIMPSSSLMPYNPSSSALISNLLPVKQLAEQVGKLSTMGASGSNAFTHQQNVMINIQAYPGGGGMMVPGAQYNAYPQGQNMQHGFAQGQNNMYGMAGQQMPPQYPGQQQQYMGQQGYGQQYQNKPSPTYGQNPYGNPPVSSPYSTASPLQNMQQSAYGQPVANNGMMPNQQQPTPLAQMGQMGPPSMPSPSQQYAQASSPGMKQPGQSGVRIQHVQTFSPGQLVGPNGQPVAPGQVTSAQSPGQVRLSSPNVTGIRARMPTTIRGARPTIRPGIQVQGQVRGARPGVQGPRMMKRPGPMAGGPAQKRRPDMLLPGKHDNEDCQVMAMQKQREGLPMIHSVQGAKDKLNLGSQISITKKTVKNEGSAMANMLAKRGISIKQKQKSRSPSPERPVPHIPNLPAGMSIKHTSRSSNFSIPEAKVGSGMYCKICKKMFSNPSSLSMHMTNAHPSSKIPTFKCDECPASYPKILQLQHHKRTFHNVTGPNRELGLPVVDLSQSDTLDRLSNLGIYSYIPLAPRDNGNGSFGIPVISVSNMQNGFSSSLQALGADGLLSLGPLKSVPNS